MTRLFTITFPIEAEDADEAWRQLRRMARHLRADELEERAHVEEIIGEIDEDGGFLTLEQLRARLGVAP
jgi:uncharacterized protein with von Willebrand factor type A (vWA) domain